MIEEETVFDETPVGETAFNPINIEM